MRSTKKWLPPALAIFLILSTIGLAAPSKSKKKKTKAPDNTNVVKQKDDGYRGIWFTLGQYYSSEYKKPGRKYRGYWKYGDKYSGGLGTYTAKHVPIAIYAPEVKKTFFCYGGSKDGECYLYNMISYYDHEKDLVPRPTIIHDKGGV
ncbi:MAG: hypothetical protein PVH19_06280, partial [Planctomycetia bacterium]